MHLRRMLWYCLVFAGSGIARIRSMAAMVRWHLRPGRTSLGEVLRVMNTVLYDFYHLKVGTSAHYH
jgi:hypothetical protein